MDPLPGLDAGLLDGGDHILVCAERLTVEAAGVQIQHPAGLEREVGSREPNRMHDSLSTFRDTTFTPSSGRSDGNGRNSSRSRAPVKTGPQRSPSAAQR